jgi:DNA-binding response OmpR family regulator
MAAAEILLVDDEPRIADVVVYVLEEQGFRVRTAASGDAGLRAFEERQPDLLVLDLNLPGLSGLDVFREVRRRAPRVPVIMLTARAGEVDRVLGLELGADDYVTKPFSARELAARVKAVLRRAAGAAPEPGAALRHGPIELDAAAWTLRYFGRPVAVTRGEFELLRALAEQPARVFGRDALIRRIYDEGHPVTDRTIDACVKRLRHKLLAVRRAPDPFQTVYGVGYRLNPALAGAAP